MCEDDNKTWSITITVVLHVISNNIIIKLYTFHFPFGITLRL